MESNYKLISKIENAFTKLIGSLTIMSKLKHYKKDENEIKSILETIINWCVLFEEKHELSFIDRDNLLKIYNRIEDMSDKYVYDEKISDDLADEIRIWILELMELRKYQIEEN